MLNIGSYIVETVAFAHVLPINRDYTILVFRNPSCLGFGEYQFQNPRGKGCYRLIHGS